MKQVGFWCALIGLVVIGCGKDGGSNSDSTSQTGTAADEDTGSTATVTASTTGVPPTSSTGETGDSSFIEAPDGGVDGQCDPTMQDCPEDEKCTAYSTVEGQPWNANKCVDETGDGVAGDPCNIEGGKYTGIDNCAAGFICLLTDNEGQGGACVEFCDGSMQCSQNGATCVVYNDGSLPICLTECDPLIQDCPDGQGCYNSASSLFVCFKFSGEAGEGLPGGECNYINGCQPGTACMAPEAVEGCAAQAGCCSPYCDLSDADPTANCNPTEDCVAWFMDPPPNYVDVGVCSIPQ